MYLVVLPARPSSSGSRSMGWNSSVSLCTEATSGDQRQSSPGVNSGTGFSQGCFLTLCTSSCKNKQNETKTKKVHQGNTGPQNKQKQFFSGFCCQRAAKQANSFLVSFSYTANFNNPLSYGFRLKHKHLVQNNCLRLSPNTYQVLNKIFETKSFIILTIPREDVLRKQCSQPKK